MKKHILTPIILIFAFSMLNATIYTVSNRAGSSADFPGLQQAHDGASAGDTLLIEGTDVPYGMANYTNFNKELTVIGIGFNPDKSNPKKTKIANTNYWGVFQMTSGASHSKFYGIEFLGNVLTVASTDLLFENCKFNGYLSANNHNSNNLVVRNCIFDSNNGHCVDLPSSLSITVLFENCVFDGFVHGRGNSTLNATFNHCLFLRNDGVSFADFNTSVTVTNCIFMNYNTIASGTTNGTFSNNIVLGSATMPPDGNSGSANLVDTDPLLVNYTAGEFYMPSHDYDVLTGSPAIGAGLDGTDIGVHGGSGYFSETGEVLITPIIRSMTINNTTVSSGGTLNVQLHASKPHTN